VVWRSARSERGSNVTHHRFINLNIGLDKAPGGGMKGGERSKATNDEIARALEAVRRRFEGLTFDGYVIADITGPDPKSSS
jgi:hypothetical protein